MKTSFRGTVIALWAIVLLCPASAQTGATERFLRAMVELKRSAATCEEFVRGSPLQAVQGIDQFFIRLEQPVPEVIDIPTQRSLDRLVRQHAASICNQKLQADLQRYLTRAAGFQSGKPEAWPDAPMIQFPAWCADPICSDYR